MKAFLATVCAVLGLVTAGSAAMTEEAPPQDGVAVLVEIQDAIGPATKEHFLSALELAEEQGAELVLLVLDTPGGLDAAMRDIIQGILNSSDPGRDLCVPLRRTCRECRDLHPLRQPRRGDDARHEPRRRHTGFDRRPTRAGRTRRQGRRQGRRQAATARHRDGAQGGQRRRCLHPEPRRTCAVATSTGRKRRSAAPPACRRRRPCSRA